jgi:hypothetical protein
MSDAEARTEPRRFPYGLGDPCKGEMWIAFTTPPQFGEGMGDYSGEGWVPLGITGYEVRIWQSEIHGADPVLQYRSREGSE